MTIRKLYVYLDIILVQKILVTMVMSLSVVSILETIGITVYITIYI